MQPSKRAVEAYWRTRLIDHVTTDDDKIAPVYRLDEICDTVRSSSGDVVREMVDYSFKRLDSKSPRVKQKTLRMIKYVTGKGGPEFRRQMQRQSAAIRKLFEYKGQLDALRGDALNKAVRDTAHEAIAAIFASEDKLPPMENVNKRIMGFGNTSMDSPTEGKKSMLTEVVGEVVEFGSASIRQGLNRISGYSSGSNGSNSNDFGSYRGPSLRKSLTSERETFDRLEQEETRDWRVTLETTNSRAGPTRYDTQLPEHEVSNGRGGAEHGRGTSQEERLLETITAPGGMRLQPTRENLQAFLANAIKLEPNHLGCALQSKLRSHAWQVRFKALCVLEAILRQKDNDFFSVVVELFEGDAGVIHECLQSSQTSLREKAKKVLDHLGAFRKDPSEDKSEGPADFKDVPTSVVHNMPDLIDTGESDLSGNGKGLSDMSPTIQDDILRTTNFSSTAAGDLLGDGLWSGTAEATFETVPDDLFTGVSFTTGDDVAGELTEDLFTGLSVDDRPSGDEGVDLLLNSMNMGKAELTDVSQPAVSDSLADLVGNISLSYHGRDGPVDGSHDDGSKASASAPVQAPHNGIALAPQNFGRQSNPQMMYLNPSLMLPAGMVGGFQAPFLMAQNYGAGTPGSTFFQQQLISGMAGLQRFGVNSFNGGMLDGNSGSGRVIGASFPDGFDFSSGANPRYTAATNATKKEDTKAFDFIADHVSAARGSKNFP